MKTSVVVILALAAPSLAGCAGFGFAGGASSAKPVAAALAQPTTAAAGTTQAAQPIAPVAPVQAQPLPPATPVAAAQTQPAQSPAPAITASVALGGVLGGPIGASLTEADREAAWKAQIAALDSGQRHSWRGAHGVFGFVEPGSETGGGCRAYSQTIYVSGRPTRGQGVACKQADGTWRMTS
jgi:surface antigen